MAISIQPDSGRKLLRRLSEILNEPNASKIVLSVGIREAVEATVTRFLTKDECDAIAGEIEKADRITIIPTIDRASFRDVVIAK